jgi:hypothetical protein
MPCDAPCTNQNPFLQEKRACASGLNRLCEPSTKCKDAECPPGFYESATCTDPEGPKFCTPCCSCSRGQYQSKTCATQHDRECSDCTSECPDVVAYAGIVGECKTGLDKVDAVACVPAFQASARRQEITVPTAGRSCGANEWYVGSRTPMYAGAAAQDIMSVADTTYPFKSDFSPHTFNTVAFLGVVGGSTADTRRTVVSVFYRKPGERRHYALANILPQTNYFGRLDSRGSLAGKDVNYPVASTTTWNAVDVMLSHDETSVYVFFSYTFDFIAKCSLGSALVQASKVGAGDNSSGLLPYQVPESECTYLSPKAFATATIDGQRVTGTSFTYKGCTRMHPMPYLACLYDALSTRLFLYAVEEATGRKMLLDSRDLSYASVSDFVNRPKSPPTWDPVNKRVFYMADMDGSSGNSEMALRFVRVNATRTSAGTNNTEQWTLHGRLESGTLWRGASSDSFNYHSLSYTVRSPQSGGAAVIMAACTPPTCPQDKSLVSFRGFFAASDERGTASFSESANAYDLGVRWFWDSDYSVFVGQQLYVLSRADKMWGMWTHCAPCPVNSFSPAGSLSGGIDACKCSNNYYGALLRPVVDVCMGCRIKFEPDGVTISPGSVATSCSTGQYKTNVPCLSTNEDRTVDSTCAACYPSCAPGDASTLFPGKYISRKCDGRGFEPVVGCTRCTDFCDADDTYIRPEVVCLGKADYDTRPSQACAPCTVRCDEGAYVTNRCLKSKKPTNNTALCASCAPCANGQYISRRCTGLSFADTRLCAQCTYGANVTGSPPSVAKRACPTGSFVLNECSDGVTTADETACSQCNQNCKPANYSKGDDGQVNF